MLNLQQIRNALSSDISPHLDDDGSKHAAVLVAIYGREPRVIMTEKAKILPQHGGEIAFPGGQIIDNDADLLDTAIRETSEELSLTVSRNHVIGQLKPVTTRNSGFTIVPFVTILEEIPQLRPNPEVEEILYIPLVPLLQTLDIDDNKEHRALFEAYKLTYQNRVIWGASARILKQISDVFKQGSL